jgi:hypothetical protein
MNTRPFVEVQDIFVRYGAGYRNARGTSMSAQQLRVMHAIEICRTDALGGHTERCDRCGHVRISYNSCRNRHCPKCQFLKKESWLEQRQRDILPIPYFHIVFTIPDTLNPLALRNQRILYDILFQSSSEALKELARDKKYLGAEIGFICILHTWGQNLMDHPHIHCIVTGGGLSPDNMKWLYSRKKFFLPAKVLSRLFRGKFLYHLKKSYEKGKLAFPGTIAHLRDKHCFLTLVNTLFSKEWIVYLKPPFNNAQTVFQYLSRYTHRIAISNHRIISIDNNRVLFRWRDYTDGGTNKIMALDAFEFIRRFLLHVLPNKYVKIRYYGILANRFRAMSLQKVRLILDAAPIAPALSRSWKERLVAATGIDIDKCPSCGCGTMIIVEILLPARCKGP